MKQLVLLYRLANDEFSKWLWPISLLCMAMVVVTPWFLRAAVRDYSPYTVHERFEDLYLASGCIPAFVICLILLCGYFLVTIYADYWGSKAIYTYLTLPARRESVYFSKLLAFLVCLLLLLAAHLIGVRIGCGLVMEKIGSYADGQFVMNNAWFLASIRSPFLRLILPPGFSGMLSTFSILLAAAAAIYYGALSERSKRRRGFLPIGIAVYLMVDIIGYRLQHFIYDFSYSKLYVNSALLLLLSVFFIGHSLRLIRKGAIA